MIETYAVLTAAGFLKGGYVSFKRVQNSKSLGLVVWAFIFGGVMCAVMWPIWAMAKLVTFLNRR